MQTENHVPLLKDDNSYTIQRHLVSHNMSVMFVQNSLVSPPSFSPFTNNSSVCIQGIQQPAHSVYKYKIFSTSSVSYLRTPFHHLIIASDAIHF